jgi:hypothetical protein
MSTHCHHPENDADTGCIYTGNGTTWTFYNQGGYEPNPWSFLEFGDYGTYEGHSFIRFRDVKVPKGAIITYACLDLYVSTFYPDGATSCPVKFYFEKSTSPVAVSSVSDFNAKSLTTAYTDLTFTNADAPFKYKNDIEVTTIIQELIDQSGWAATLTTGYDMQCLIKAQAGGNGRIYMFTDDAVSYYQHLWIEWTYTVPDPPTSLTVTRVGDTSQSLAWTNHSAAGKPYVYLKIERSSDGTNWSQIKGDLSPTSTSYTDTTTSANGKYYYRVRAYNYAGNSTYATSTPTYIKTTPSPVTNVVAVRDISSVNISWTNNSPNADNIKIERSETPYSTWVEVDYTLSGVSTAKVDSSPYATLSKYRVWSYVTTNTLSSAYAYSNEIPASSPPSTPTSLTPDSGLLIDTALAKLFTWQHNPTDTSAQTKISLQYRKSGDAWPANPQLEEYALTDEFYTFPLSTFDPDFTYEWQVKTWGGNVTGSAWSSTATFTTSTKPTIAITSPGNGSSYGYSVLVVNWTFADAESDTQIQAIIKLYNSLDQLLETKTVYGTALTTTFSTYLENSASYKVKMQSLDSAGLWSVEAESDFTTSFLLPPQPDLTITYNDDVGTANILITSPAPTGGEIGASYNQLYKSIDGVNYELLLDNIVENTTVTDYLPLLNGTTYYYAVAVSTNPTTKTSYVHTLVNALTGIFFINGETSFSTSVRIVGDTSYTEKRGRNEVLRKFEGRNYKVKYQGDELKDIINFSCDLPFTNYDSLIDIIESTEDVFYRDWKGRWFLCSLSDCTFEQKDNDAYQFSCIIEKIEE